jgi:ribosome-binding protein aMBF1 (putative translation factor)
MFSWEENDMQKRIRRRPEGRRELAYQEPHRTGAGNGKLLEAAIGREVKRYREKLGITISELAKAAEMSAGMLSKIASGPGPGLAGAGDGPLPRLRGAS